VKKRILFVDDEPKILHGLERMLRPFRKEWDTAFAESGSQALEMMARESFDVVISDMRMPRMDGAELLEEIKQRHPGSVRIILSGHSSQELALKSVGPAHQYLAKPCNADSLRSTIERALSLQQLLTNERVRELVAKTGSVPSLPSVYLKIQQILRSPDASIPEIGKVLAQDVGMSAKLLQIANSAFFGIRGSVSTPTEAAFRLGVDTVKALVLSLHVFSTFDRAQLARLRLESVSSHSMSVAVLAGRLARAEKLEASQVDNAFTAGLLHDLGKVVLAANVPEDYEKALEVARARGITVWEAELESLGATHAEVGAYLLGLWGLSHPIVEALAYHHRPGGHANHSFSPLTAIHVANVLQQEGAEPPTGARCSEIDLNYLEKLGIAGRLPAWRQLRDSA